MTDLSMSEEASRELSLAWRYPGGRAVATFAAQVMGSTEAPHEPGYQVTLAGLRSCRWWNEANESSVTTDVADLPDILRSQVAGLVGSAMTVSAPVLDNGIVEYIESPDPSVAH